MSTLEQLTLISAGRKDDSGKAPWDLLPRCLEHVVAAYAHGAVKYDAWNWSKGMAWSRLFAALMRHVLAFWWHGERWDKDSKCHHLASVIFCALCLMEYDLEGLGEDDRHYKGGESNGG